MTKALRESLERHEMVFTRGYWGEDASAVEVRAVAASSGKAVEWIAVLHDRVYDDLKGMMCVDLRDTGC